MHLTIKAEFTKNNNILMEIVKKKIVFYSIYKMLFQIHCQELSFNQKDIP